MGVPGLYKWILDTIKNQGQNIKQQTIYVGQKNKNIKHTHIYIDANSVVH